jgi:hypothetical protein
MKNKKTVYCLIAIFVSAMFLTLPASAGLYSKKTPVPENTNREGIYSKQLKSSGLDGDPNDDGTAIGDKEKPVNTPLHDTMWLFLLTSSIYGIYLRRKTSKKEYN